MTSDQKELEVRLVEVGSRLSSPPADIEELLALLDETTRLLSQVEQSPSESLSNALEPLKAALVARGLLDNTDLEVKVGVTSSICEITRITAPNSPYEDAVMKEIFVRIVEEFELLGDVSSRSFPKRAAILQTVAKVRCCAVMLDLECDHLVLKMFRHFLNTVRPENSSHVSPYMETIMTLVIEESEELSSDLVSCLLDCIKIEQDNLPVAHRLGEKVISNCAEKLKPRLRDLSPSMNLSDYSPLITSILHDAKETDTVTSGDIMGEQGLRGAEEATHQLNKGKAKIDDNSAAEADGTTSQKKAAAGVEDSDFVEPVGEDFIPGSSVKPDTMPYKESNSGDDSEKDTSISEGETTRSSTPVAAQPSNKPEKGKVVMSSGSEGQKTLGKQKLSSKRAGGVKEIAPSRRRRLDETFVGARIKVWWPEDKQYYPGTVGKYDHFSKKHKILYDDGDIEILLMENERWAYIDRNKDERDLGHSSVEPPTKRAKLSYSSGATKKEISNRGIESDPPKRRGRPPKRLSLGGGSPSGSGKAICRESAGSKLKDAAPKSKAGTHDHKEDAAEKSTKGSGKKLKAKMVINRPPTNPAADSQSDMVGLL